MDDGGRGTSGPLVNARESAGRPAWRRPAPRFDPCADPGAAGLGSGPLAIGLTSQGSCPTVPPCGPAES